MQLADLVVPATTVVLTQECQKGVIGDLSLLPALAESARATGMIENVGRIVKVGRDAGCGVLHCIAATRADRRGASTNAPLFAGTAKRPVTMLPGSEGTELVDGIEAADSDLVSTRIGGLSPVNGTEVPTLLRNLGAKTVVIAGVSTNVAIPNATFDCVNVGVQRGDRARRDHRLPGRLHRRDHRRTRSRWSPRSARPTSWSTSGADLAQPRSAGRPRGAILASRSRSCRLLGGRQGADRRLVDRPLEQLAADRLALRR